MVTQEEVDQSIHDLIKNGDNEFFGLKIANKIFKVLFYQDDFKDLTHPVFFKKRGNKKVGRKRRARSRSASFDAQEEEILERTSKHDELGAPVHVYKRQRRESADSSLTSKSALSALTDKSGRTPRYISKKRKL